MQGSKHPLQLTFLNKLQHHLHKFTPKPIPPTLNFQALLRKHESVLIASYLAAGEITAWAKFANEHLCRSQCDVSSATQTIPKRKQYKMKLTMQGIELCSFV